MTDVIVQLPENGSEDGRFFETLPASYSGFSTDQDYDEDYAPLLSSYGAIKCRFGRVGETIAVYLNSTHVKCVTPSMSESPQDIHRETVVFSLAMNGLSFDEDTSSLEYTFVGTGSMIGMKWVVIAILCLAPCVAGFIYFSQSAAMSFSF
jgi:hypothetical protein